MFNLLDYDIPALNNPTIAYIASATLGVAIARSVAILAFGWLLARLTRSHAEECR